MTHLSGETLEILGRLVKLMDVLTDPGQDGKAIGLEVGRATLFLSLFSEAEIAAAEKLADRETFR